MDQAANNGSTGAVVTCEQLSATELLCNGTVYEESERLTPENEWFWIYLGIYVALVLVAGLMSGLTMGLLSLDVTSLTVLSTGGHPHEQKHARKILPLLRRHHLLLVTLLLANAAAVESMPLFLDKVSNPVTAIVVSVTAVLLFGEVVPQAFCTRYGLAIGATMSPLVYALMAVTLPVSWPLAKLLDCVLGTEHGTFFRRAELRALVDIHTATETDNAQNEEPLTRDEATVITGALSLRDKYAGDVCTRAGDIFALRLGAVMNRATMDLLLEKGHSRVPVLDDEDAGGGGYLGLMLVKALIKIDPDDNLPVREVFERHRRDLLAVTEDTQLYECLNLFQMGKSHMFMVVRTGGGRPRDATFRLAQGDHVLGCLTLEDVIEELIQEEIIDETDEYVDNQRRVKVARGRSVRAGSAHVDNKDRGGEEEEEQRRGDLQRFTSVDLSSSAGDGGNGSFGDRQPLLGD